MNKAFTSEETQDAPPLLPPLHKGTGPRYITAAGLHALQQELARLNGPARDTLKATFTGAQLESRLKDLDAHAAHLAARLDMLTVPPPPAPGETRIYFGAWVTVREHGKEKTWRLVGPDEANAQAGLLGVDAPLAKALLGAAAGDDVEVEMPQGERLLHVVAVKYPPG